MSAAFRCGHPRTPENTISTSYRFKTCRFCQRVRRMVDVAIQRQERINAGLPPRGHCVAGEWL